MSQSGAVALSMLCEPIWEVTTHPPLECCDGIVNCSRERLSCALRLTGCSVRIT